MVRTPPTASSWGRAFTLIELLVVIAIIAILAAILFPVFASAKRAAQSAVNISNMKQLATSARLYQLDYDNLYPSRNALGGAAMRASDDPYSLPTVLNPYVKSKAIWFPPNGKPSLKPFGNGYNWNISTSVTGNDPDSHEDGPSGILIAWEAFNIKEPAKGAQPGVYAGAPAVVPVTAALTESSSGRNQHCTSKGGKAYTTVYGDTHIGSIWTRLCPANR